MSLSSDSTTVLRWSINRAALEAETWSMTNAERGVLFNALILASVWDIGYDHTKLSLAQLRRSGVTGRYRTRFLELGLLRDNGDTTFSWVVPIGWKAPSEVRRTRSKRRPISPRLRWTILERDGFKCRYCGRTAEAAALHVDHIIPVAQGGTNHPDNLAASCSDCNLGKADNTIKVSA